ncbi:MAG: 16S rRNA (cytosine(1402)-N(4))-methyltransferase RsmH, partial [Gammaproteobacteria bacterium]|nr:16S rRNA (cytosine(1402)-N(4))-methyltransferase RsmH [Gammaproteobacteria bacterium]
MHKPVLLEEVLEALVIKENGVYVDGTYGRGGHAAQILSRLGPEGRLLAFDKDPDAIADAQRKFGGDKRFGVTQGAYTMLERVVETEGLAGKVNGILLDLGVSSPQLDDPERGFSFSLAGPLDMRMNNMTGISAAQWLANAGEKEISDVLKNYGEERFHRRIARAIVKSRQSQPMTTTGQLADIVAAAV